MSTDKKYRIKGTLTISINVDHQTWLSDSDAERVRAAIKAERYGEADKILGEAVMEDLDKLLDENFVDHEFEGEAGDDFTPLDSTSETSGAA